MLRARLLTEKDGEGARVERLSDEMVAAVQAHPAYQELLRKRGRFGWVMSAFMTIVFLGFTLAIAFDKAALAAPIGTGVTSIGIPIGFAIILLAIGITAIYVRRANQSFDALTARIREDIGA